MLSLFVLLVLQRVHASVVTLVQPVPTSIPTLPSFSLPSVSLPSGFSFSTPSITLPTTSFSIPSISATASFSVSVGGFESADDATTYVLEEILGVTGSTTTLGRTIVQGATVWHEDDLHETCSLDGKGGALCTIGVEGFTTAFTGSAFPLVTVGANGEVQGGSPGATLTAPGGSSSTGGGTKTGGAASLMNARASMGWVLAAGVGAVVFGMRLVL